MAEGLEQLSDEAAFIFTFDFITVLLSIVLVLIVITAAIQVRNHNQRMGWFIASVCVIMCGLMSQITAENAYLRTSSEYGSNYYARSLTFYAVAAPLFTLYFIDTERDEGKKWDGYFWTMLQTLVSILFVVFVVLTRTEYFVYLAFLVQYAIILAMLLVSSKDIKASLGFIIGICFPIAAALLGMYDSRINVMGAGLILMHLIVFFGYQADMERELMSKRAELSENKLSLLMDQIHPHFIYNSLQQIALLCDEEPESVKPAILNFSGYLRKNLESLTNVEMIPFSREMEHVDMFIALSEILPSRSFVVKRNFEVEDFYIPALTVQPLVENAIKYGIGMSEEGNEILIETKEEGGFINIRVVDNGHGKKTELSTQKKHKSVGTKNVITRLDMRCDGTLAINKLEKGTEAIVKIPAMKAQKPKQ